MKLHLLLAYSTLAQIQVKKYYGEGFILSCTVRCDRRTRSLDNIEWLRRVATPRQHDLDLSRLEINGEWFERLETINGSNLHYPMIHTFKKRKCELVSKLHFMHTSPIEMGEYLCTGQSKIHQSFNVKLIENEQEPSYLMELLLSSVLLMVLLIALLITIIQHYRPRHNHERSYP